MGNLQLSPGSLFANRFEIQRAAGSGGMGTVYCASDRYTGDTVALKLLHAGGGGPDEAERFVREAQLLSELRHPGIVGHVAHGQTPAGQGFLAMEWLDGQDLGERLLRGPLPVRDCLRLLEQVSEALSVAHERGIIHRDLKPSNLFLVRGDLSRVKLLDFGIARRIATSRAMTKTGMVVGTPEYMAPEQARGSRDLTPATDVFSLGCVLYECLTGQPPFVADHIAAVLVRILFEEPLPVQEVRPGISPALSSLLARLLAKHPEQRVADAAALRAELHALGELPEPGLAVTMASPPPKTESFAETEQSLYSIVLAASLEEDIGLGATQAGSAVQLDSTDRQALLQALARLGGSPDFLANGTLVVTVPPLGSAQDQATLAARAALLIKERWPEAVVSMATGRGAVRGQTAVGEVVEMAARSLKTGNQPSHHYAASGVLMDSLSAKLLEGRFVQTLLPGGALLLAEEVEADESRPLLGKPTPCVGREAELSLLEAQLQSCIEESEARVILITAPPGAGKSRLRHEFLRRVGQRSDAVTLLKGRGDLMSAGAAYGILGQMIRRLCKISDGEPRAAQQDQLRARIATHLPAAEQDRCVLFIGELCGIPFSEAGQAMLLAARQDARIMRDQMRQAFLDWMRAECGAAPVLLLLDDLQWGDALSILLLDEMLRELRSASLLLLALARPEVHDQFPKLWQAHHPQDIPLKGLSKKAGERLIQHVLGKQVDPKVAARLVEQAGGNALFLEELIRSAAEGKSEEQPDTVLAMLQARIGRFDAGARRALLAASVLGPTVWLGGIAAILGRGAASEELDRWLSSLTEQEVLEPHAVSQLSNQKEFGFRHILVREAAYSLLGDADRTTGHRMAGEFLEAAGEPNPAIIAEHFERGGERTRAAVFYARAAESALEHFAPADALSWAEKGIACVSEGDSAVLWPLRAIEIYARMLLGQVVRSFEGGLLTLPHLRPGSPLWCRTMEALVLGAALGTPEMKRQLPEIAGRLLCTDPEAGAEAVYASALAFLTGGSSIAAPIPQVRMISERLRVVSERVADRNPVIMRFYGWGYGHFQHHRVPTPWAILQEAEEAAKLCRQAGDVRMLTFILLAEIALTWAELGDMDRASRAVEEAKQAAQRTQDAVARGLARIYPLSLRIETEALADVPASVAVAQEELRIMGTASLFAVSALDVQARGYLRLRQIPEAEAAARQAAAAAQTIPAYEPTWRATLMRILQAKGDLPDAMKEAESAQRVLSEMGCLGNAEVELRLAACEVFHAAGQTERAKTGLSETLRQIELRTQDIPDPFWKDSYRARNPYCLRAQQLAKEWGIDVFVK